VTFFQTHIQAFQHAPQMLIAEADTERLLKPLLQFSQGAIRLFPQLAQQLSLHCGCYTAHGAVTALRDPFHLLAVQSLAGNLLGIESLKFCRSV
jgi:hypothetical protein